MLPLASSQLVKHADQNDYGMVTNISTLHQRPNLTAANTRNKASMQI